MTKGRYVGTTRHLHGRTALLMKRHPAGQSRPGKVYAQFDDSTLTEAWGWHEFDLEDFKIVSTARKAMI